jgi:uncharacterized protein (TIGR02145 family)
MERKNLFLSTNIIFASVLLLNYGASFQTDNHLKTKSAISEDNNPSVDVVKIGTQTWAAKNLNIDKFMNGDLIPEAKTDEEWKRAGQNKQPAWCYYNNEPANGNKYGKLYNWYAVNDPRGIVPNGYHVPTIAEWEALLTYLEGKYAAGKKMKSTTDWVNSGEGSNTTNSSGFSALPGGGRNAAGEFGGSLNFNTIGEEGIWWSSTEEVSTHPWNGTKWMDVITLRFLWNSEEAIILNRGKEFGYAVRFLKD